MGDFRQFVQENGHFIQDAKIPIDNTKKQYYLCNVGSDKATDKKITNLIYLKSKQ